MMSLESALTNALRALGWLVGNDELMPVFLGATGASVDELRSRAEEPEFLLSVLDFLLMNDAWVVSFCDMEGLGYDVPHQARQVLAGPSEAHWT